MLIPFIIIGITTGSVYALAAVGLTLTYKTTGVFNFAFGGVGAAAAYFFYDTHVEHGWSWPVSAAVVVLVAAPLVGLGLEVLGRALARVSVVMQIVGTVGLLLAIEGIATIRYGSATIAIPPYLSRVPHKFLGALVGVDEFVIAGFALLASVGLSLFLRYSSFGLRARAVVDQPELVALTGVNPTRIGRFAWCIGSMFAAASGLLTVQISGALDPTILFLISIQAFGAAAIGRFRSIPLSYVGGILIGVAAALATKWVATTPALSGLPPGIPFIVLFAVLIATPKRTVIATTLRDGFIQIRPALAGPRLRAARTLGGFCLLAAVPLFVHAQLPSFNVALIDAILLLSLGLLVKMSGQVSMCHAGFAAIGASTFAHASSAGFPWMLALLAAGLVAVPVGALVAIPAIRLTGLYLALATFGFGILLEQLFYLTSLMFTSYGQLPVPRPAFATGAVGYYYVCLAVVVLCAGSLLVVKRSRLGRLLRGLAESPLALTTNGASINVTKLIVFCISAFWAAIAGALLGPITLYATNTPFTSLQSLTLITILVIAGGGDLRYAFVGAFGLAVIPAYLTSASVSAYLTLIFGVSAMAVAAASRGTFQIGRMLPLAVRLRLGPSFGGTLPDRGVVE